LGIYQFLITDNTGTTLLYYIPSEYVSLRHKRLLIDEKEDAL